ncbi:MAG TPA: acyltransferase [Arthrobacter sp.]|nr:acyltransferase [Arthrobacter sp.]
MLGSRFAESKNSLNAIRLLLAAAVILSHTWWLGGYGPEPHPGDVKLGTWAVLGFFGISGYLISRSRVQSRTAADYFAARFLRIFPGLAVCAAAVAFCIAPLTAGLAGRRYSLPDALLYFLTNLSAGTPGVAVGGIPGSLDGLPDPRLWNGPLWTLFWEIVCYVFIGIVFVIFRPGLARLALLSVFILGSAAALAVDAGWFAAPTPYDWPLIPVVTFLAGSLVYLYQDTIPANRAVLLISGGVVVLVASLGFASSLVHLPLCIFLILGSLHLPLSGVGSRYDISFGVYIYGWPTQQFLSSLGLHEAAPPLVFAAASLLLVAPMAWLSCRYVEKPFQRWRRSRDIRRRVEELA